MNLDFSYYMPTRILFGCGKLKELSTTPFVPGTKALIVIGASGAMRRHGYLDRAIEYLKANNVDSVVYDKIQPNPVSEHVEEGAAVAKENQCDFVVGLGGGSTIDSAKSIAVMAVNAVTTTAGTGTEADPWTVITKSETNEKIGWGSPFTFPTLSIVDPELMLSVPPKQTAYTGMDAFFHSVESYLATVSQPTSDHLAQAGLGQYRGGHLRVPVLLHLPPLHGARYQRLLSRRRARRGPDNALGLLLQLPGRTPPGPLPGPGAGHG